MRSLLSLLLAGVVAFAATPAAASPGDPLKQPLETGQVGLMAGVRWVPPGALVRAANRNGWALTGRSPVTPFVLLPFSYRVDARWSVAVELGWASDSYGFHSELVTPPKSPDGQLSVQTFAVLVGGQRAFDLGWERVEPYVGFGVGYYLNWLSLAGSLGDLPKRLEAHATGGYLSAGLRIGLGAGWGLAIEERYTFAAAGLATFGDMTVGGNTVALGVSRVWK